MTTLPGRISASLPRRFTAAALTGIVLLLVTAYAATASTALQRIQLADRGALLGALRSDPARDLDMIGTGTIRIAMAASPLEQKVVNVAMVREARQGRTNRTAAWLDLLARLGWRDTPSLQNLLYVAALHQDLSRILNVSDVLLRRQALMDQIIPMLALLEGDPRLRTMLAARLAGNPSWRAPYLGNTGALQTRGQLLARFATVRALQTRGKRLDPGEIAANINALDRGDLPAYGFVLWRTIRPQVARPLDDSDFALASHSDQASHDPVPYQWQTMTGDGFSADITRDAGQAQLSINWDGRGVPVFAQQRTSAEPGRYALALSVPRQEASDLSAIVFRLVCPGTTIAFQPAGTMRYVTADAVPCAYPLLQIAGDVQSASTPHQFAINRIVLTPLARGTR